MAPNPTDGNAHISDELLLRYRYDTLEPAETASVSAHLRTCSQCATRFAELGRSLDLLGQYDAEAELDEDRLAAGVLARARELAESERVERERREAEQARIDAERSLREAERAAAAVVADAAPERAPARGERAPARDERPPRERLGLWAWLGLAAGGSLRPVRVVSTLAVALGVLYVAGGALYYSRRSATIDTRVSGEDSMTPGTRGLLLVEVVNRLTHQPVAQAAVKVTLKGKERAWTLFEGKTGATGGVDAPLQLPETGDGTYQLVVTSRAAGETDRVVRPVVLRRAFKVHLSTDKPLYQPGQTVHIRALVLERPRMVPPSGKQLRLDVLDPKGNRIAREAVALSKFGVGAHSLELSDEVALGAYRIKAQLEGASSETEIKVARYTLPKFKIAIEPEKHVVLAGETFRAKVNVRYFFGKAVAGGALRAVLFRADGSVIGSELEGKTGPEGSYALAAELPAALAAEGRPEAVTIEVAVKDSAGQEERKQQSFTVARELLQLELIAEGGRAVPGMENTFYLLSTTPDGKPVAARVEVTLPDGKSRTVQTHENGLGAFAVAIAGATPPSAAAAAPGGVGIPACDEYLAKYTRCAESRMPEAARATIRSTLAQMRSAWSQAAASPGGREALENACRVALNATRQATASFGCDWDSPAGGGGAAGAVVPGENLSFQLKAEDASGRRASRSISLGTAFERVLVATDRAFYRPGESVKVGVQAISQYSAAVVEAIREGQTVVRARAPLASGKGQVELDLPPGISGTLRLDVYAVDPYEVRSNRVSRKIVVAERQGLKVTLAGEAASYRPGAQAKLRFEVRDADGKPRAAAIGLTVVDESVFALSASRPALARAYFLLERSLLEPRHGLSAAEMIAAGWGDPEQQAGRLLFSFVGEASPPARFSEQTYEAKVSGLLKARTEFEERAWQVGIAVGLVLVLVLLVAAARTLPAWAGGILLAIAGVVALMIPVGLLYVVLGLAAGIVLALVIHRQRTGAFGWAYVVLPALGVVVTSALFAPQLKPDTAAPPVALERQTPVSGVTPTAPPTGLALPREVAPQGVRDAEDGAVKAEPRRLARPEAAPAPLAGAEAAKREEGGMGRARGGGTGAGYGAIATRSEVKAIPRREVRVRQHFPETMYVHPELVADENGVAELKLPLADSITEWRISALASAADGKLGSLERPLKVFQDFFVDLDTPVALVRGDEATIPIAVYNYLSEPQTVRLEIKREPWFELVGKAELAVKLGPGAVEGQELKLRVLQPGRHRLSLRADGTRLSDALARELLVSEAGQERSDAVSGMLSPGETVRVTVQVPDAAVKGSSHLLVKLFPSRLASALDGLENSLRMPNGCFEQTSSATYPNVLIVDYLKRAGKLTPEFKARATRYIALGYQRLLRYEVAGGGFEWFGRAPANQVLTAYGLMEFKDMSRVYSIDEAVIARTQRWLVSRQQQDGSWVPDRSAYHDGLWRSGMSGSLMVTAYVGWSLAESGYQGAPLDRALGYLARNLERIDDPYTLSLTLAAFARTKHASTAAVASRLAAKATRNEKLVSFAPAEATVYYGRGAGGSVETTALAVHALALAGKEPALVQGGLGYLASTRDPRGTWYSTQGTILALRALLGATGADGDQTVSIRINGQDAGSQPLKASEEKPQLVDLGPRARAGANVVELAGQVSAPFQVIARYTLPWREKGVDETAPLALKVEYGRTKVEQGGIVPLEIELLYRRPEASGMALLGLGIPAGLTPVPEDLEAMKSSGQVARYEQEAGKVNLYLDRLATNTKLQLKLRLKARSKVKTAGSSSLAYLYYHPEVRAVAPPTPVVVN